MLTSLTHRYFSAVPAHTDVKPGNTWPPAVKPQSDARLFSVFILAVLIWRIYCSVCVFSQGLLESAEGWEDEGNLVSEAYHLLCLFISSFDTFFLHFSLISPTLTFFLDDWICLRAGKSGDPCIRPGHDGLQLALLPVPSYLRQHSSNLGHVVALTLPRCQLFSLSGSSCSSMRLMRFSFANITTHHYCAAFCFHPDRKTLIEESNQRGNINLVPQNFVMTDRTDVVQVWVILILRSFYQVLTPPSCGAAISHDLIKTCSTVVFLQDMCQMGTFPVWLWFTVVEI